MEFTWKFLYKKSNFRCEVCGYEGYNLKTGNTILQIHHIDGNSKNNSPDNLQVICPNCHAKTENYMALNKGNSGRDKRYKNKEDKPGEPRTWLLISVYLRVCGAGPLSSARH